MSTSKFDTSKPLKHHVKMAIANHDLRAMYALKDICDKLHAGVPEVDGFTVLPDDQLYEEMDRCLAEVHELSLELDAAIKADSSNCKIVTAKGLLNSQRPKCRVNEAKLSDLWMGSIPKLMDVKAIPNAIIMPKFDGCSCGVKYVRSNEGIFEPVKATTRGIDTSHKQQNTDILDKYVTVGTSLTAALNDELKSDDPYTFSNGLTLANIYSLTIRGEIVALDKAQVTTAAAPYVAGKINGGMQVWKAALANICFIPYEIMRMQLDDPTYNRLKLEPDDEETLLRPPMPMSSDAPAYILRAQSNKIDPTLLVGIDYTPSQTETIELLDRLGQITYDTFDSIDLKSDQASLDLILEFFQHYQNELAQPVDGVVYCGSEWRYPQVKSESTTSSYTKYAWKPTSESTTKLTGVIYNISRDGKIGLETTYDPIRMNGKTFTRCKTAPTRMNKLAGIGIGSVITIELCKDINPQIKEFEEDPNIEPYQFPTKCPFCNHAITRRDGKSKAEAGKVILTCTNKGCLEQLIQKYKFFLGQLKIKGVAEGKLRKLGKKMNLRNIIHQHLSKTPNAVYNALSTITIRSFLFGLGFGTSNQIEKATPDINDFDLMVDHFDELIVPLIGKTDDPFVKDVLDYVDKNCFEAD